MRKKADFGSIQQTCQLCNNSKLKNIKALQLHLVKYHQNTKDDLRLYYDKYIKTSDEGICPISGNTTRFLSLTKGYEILSEDTRYSAMIPTQINYWVYKHNKTEQEAKELVSLEQSARSKKSKHPRSGMIRCKEYWIDKFNFTEQQAETAISSLQRENSYKDKNKHINRKSLSYKIEKYGEEEGTKIFEENKEKRKKFKRLTHAGNISNIEATICWMLYHSGFKSAKFFDKQLVLTDNVNNCHYRYDFCYRNSIIEINGSYYHGTHYNTEYVMRGGRQSSTEIIAYNHKKVLFAKECGYRLLSLSDTFFYDNPIKTIEMCIEFLKGTLNVEQL